MAATNGSTVIVEKSVGYRTVMNTNFGRTATVRREQWGTSVTWLVQITCNGVADYSQAFKTRREAMEDFDGIEEYNETR